MAVRHQLIERSPEAVWAVLADGSRYGEWVVGTHRAVPDEGTWPEVDSSIEYTIKLGPWQVCGHTYVRRCEPPRELELEVDSGPLGTARIAIEIRPWGRYSLLIMDEHPLRGPGARLHNAALDAVLQLRHRSMLGRLADVVEHSPRKPGEPV
ncbi:SRPBCC family protein [Streptomyces stramineus]|uniref:SRPBCC family protein n=1 Tax=Streptomyces stramineus TaxID=173861 RepID=A0ABP3JQJ8_9ACTN